jgi:hypothetical protein
VHQGFFTEVKRERAVVNKYKAPDDRPTLFPPTIIPYYPSEVKWERSQKHNPFWGPTRKADSHPSLMVENLPPKDDQGALRGEKF